jgi:UPF0755 protein
MSRTFTIAVLVVALVFGGAGLGAYRYYDGQLHNPQRSGQPAISLDIPDGTSVAGIADILGRAGVIDNPLIFTFYVRSRGLGARLQAGHYQVQGGLSMLDVIAMLEHSSTGKQLTITFPEGLTLKQMAEIAGKKGLFAAEKYLEAAQKDTYAQPFLSDRKPGAGLEGYLFPETYFIAPDITPHDLVDKQLGEFGRRVPPELRAHASNHNLTFAQALVLASIIEREARFDNDRPQIAAVFYNRLARGMALEADATLLYARGATSGSITDDDKKVDSPYNTYKHTGLPPTPICNPGLAAIKAALDPAQNDYYFYFTDKDGHAHFAKTFAEFQQLLVQYGLR